MARARDQPVSWNRRPGDLFPPKINAVRKVNLICKYLVSFTFNLVIRLVHSLQIPPTPLLKSSELSPGTAQFLDFWKFACCSPTNLTHRSLFPQRPQFSNTPFLSPQMCLC